MLKELAWLKEKNKSRIDWMKEHPNENPVLDEIDAFGITRDVILAGVADRVATDHIRLVKIEAMLTFILKRQVVEGRRPLSQQEKEALGYGAKICITERTALDDFEKEWLQVTEQLVTADGKPKTDDIQGA